MNSQQNIKKCTFIVNYLLLYILMKFWCQFPDNGNNVETCTSSVIKRIHRLSNRAFFGVNRSLKYHNAWKEQC